MVAIVSVLMLKFLEDLLVARLVVIALIFVPASFLLGSQACGREKTARDRTRVHAEQGPREEWNDRAFLKDSARADINGPGKEESVWQNNFKSFRRAERVVSQWIEWYNSERIHSGLAYLLRWKYPQGLRTTVD